MSVATMIFQAIAGVLLLLAPTLAQAQSFKVTLLGTGSPAPVIDRFGPSILVEAGTEKLLFDCGRGATQRIYQLKMPLGTVNTLFLTHLHSDHVVGIPDLWLTGWTTAGRREVPFRVWGPRGTTEMMSHLDQAYRFDIRIRLYDTRPSPEGVLIVAHDITEGVVYERNGVKVTAFDVDHSPVKPAFGYRIDYAGRSVVLSGDTRPSENLVRFAQGAALLIHEVVAGEDRFQSLGYPLARARTIIAHHTTPEQAGEIFTRVKPKLAVYSHMSPAAAPPEDFIVPTRKTYSGPLEVGEDLMSFEVGDRIVVRRFRQ